MSRSSGPERILIHFRGPWPQFDWSKDLLQIRADSLMTSCESIRWVRTALFSGRSGRDTSAKHKRPDSIWEMKGIWRYWIINIERLEGQLLQETCFWRVKRDCSLGIDSMLYWGWTVSGPQKRRSSELTAPQSHTNIKSTQRYKNRR